MSRLSVSLFLLMCVLLAGCSDNGSDGTNINVHLDGANGLTANLDRVILGGENEMLKNTNIDGEGNFTFAFATPLENGLYQVRVGAQRATFALSEADHDINIDGDLSSFGRYEFAVSGSKEASETVSTMRRIGDLTGLDGFEKLIKGVKSDQAAAYITYSVLMRAGKDGLPLHEAAIERLPDDDPGRIAYAEYIAQLKQQIAFEESQRLIKPGQPAPDLQLTGPDGKQVNLSDLKGKVVLLDFWAAWCGPCRRENPNVVKVYDRYKDKGFTVYSVSLDGVGDAKASRLSPEQLEIAKENQRQRWVDAIAQDGLSWDSHGSELRHWNGEASAKYGVRGIPATFLIDRDGKIAEVGLRGAASIEQALQKVL